MDSKLERVGRTTQVQLWSKQLAEGSERHGKMLSRRLRQDLHRQNKARSAKGWSGWDGPHIMPLSNILILCYNDDVLRTPSSQVASWPEGYSSDRDSSSWLRSPRHAAATVGAF